MALMVNCYVLLSLSTVDRRVGVRVKSQPIKAVPCGRWTPAKVRFCHLSFSMFTWIGSTNAAKLMSVPRLEIANSVDCYSLMIWFCFLPLNLASSAQLNSFADACNTARNENKHGGGTAKAEVLSSFKKLWSVRVTSEWSDTEAGREVQVSWGCIYEWRKARRRTGYPNRQG